MMRCALSGLHERERVDDLPAVETIRAELPALRKEIRDLDEKLSGEIGKLENR